MTSRLPLTGWRRIAGALWGAPADPQIFGALDVDAGAMLDFIARARAAGHRVTPTHLVGRGVGHALAAVPELNVQLRRGHAVPRPSIEVFFITAVAGGHDLSGVKLAAIDRTPVIEVARALTERSDRLRRGDDPEFTRTKWLMDRLPPRLLRAAMRASALITEDLRRDVPALGLHRSPFGSAMVSSVGMLGLPHGFAPLGWMYDVPILVLVGELTRKPVVVGDAIVARDILPITATIDHRYADAAQIAALLRAFRAYLAAPADHEPPLT